MSELDAKKLRSAFGRYMTGVTVVTAKAQDGSHVGFTANSFTSVSLNPPLLLVCPGNHLSSIDVFRGAEHFAVNILAEDQESVSNSFASSKGDRFAETEWAEDTFGSPLIEGVSAHFSCSTFQRIEAGDHIILIGQVEAFQDGQANGLGYSSSGYFNLNAQNRVASDQSKPTRSFAGALIEHDGKLFVEGLGDTLSLPMVELKDRYRAPLAIKEYLTENGSDVDIRQTYSVFNDTKQGAQYTFFRGSAAVADDSTIGRFVDISDLDPSQFAKPGFAHMIRRFKSEFNNQQFGLFIGDETSGEVHSAPAA